MDEKLVKSLEALIDETLEEIAELKKSKFSAQEVDLDMGPGDSLNSKNAGSSKSVNGGLDKDEEAKKDEDMDKDEDKHMHKDEDEACKDEDKHVAKGEDEDEEEESEAEKKKRRMSKDEDMDKGEDEDESEEDEDDEKPKKKMKKDEMEKGVNEKADPHAGHHKADGGSMSKDEEKRMKKGVNEKADPHGGNHKADGGSMSKDEEKKMKKGEGYPVKLKKSDDSSYETLMKSYVEERMAPLETKLNSILDLVTKIGDQPLPQRGFSSRMVPLSKSSDNEVEPLSKSQISSKLWELKKSGTEVDSTDIAKADIGVDLQSLVGKYNLK